LAARPRFHSPPCSPRGASAPRQAPARQAASVPQGGVGKTVTTKEWKKQQKATFQHKKRMSPLSGHQGKKNETMEIISRDIAKRQANHLQKP